MAGYVRKTVWVLTALVIMAGISAYGWSGVANAEQSMVNDIDTINNIDGNDSGGNGNTGSNENGDETSPMNADPGQPDVAPEMSDGSPSDRS